MLGAITHRLFGTVNERAVRAYRGSVEAINALEKELEGLSDDANLHRQSIR